MLVPTFVLLYKNQQHFLYRGKMQTKMILIMQSQSCLFNQVKDRSAFSLKNIFLAVEKDAFVLKHLTPTF